MASLAELTSSSDRIIIEKYIRQVRYSLWIKIFQNHIGGSFQVCACIILLAGIINMYLWCMPITYCLLVALSPVAAGLVMAIQKKPRCIESARYIDTQFNGQSLMSTAIELLSHDEKNNLKFSPWIIHQAAQASRVWQPQTKRFIFCKLDQLTWLAGFISLLGIFFMMQPGAIKALDKTESRPVYNETIVSKPSVSSSLFTLIKQTESILQQKQTLVSGKQNEDFSIVDKNLESRFEKESVREFDKSEQTFKDGSLLNSIQINKQNSDGIGSRADNDLSTLKNKESKSLDIKLVEIPLLKGEQVNSDKLGLGFAKQQFFDLNDSADHVFVTKAQIKPVAYTSSFSPRQQQYVSAYFQKRHVQK